MVKAFNEEYKGQSGDIYLKDKSLLALREKR